MATELKTKFYIGEKVKHKELDFEGFVNAICIYSTYMQYEVHTLKDGMIKSTRIEERRLETLPTS